MENAAFIASVTSWSEQTIRTMPLERLAVYCVSCQKINGIDANYTAISEPCSEDLLDALADYLKIKQQLGL